MNIDMAFELISAGIAQALMALEAEELQGGEPTNTAVPRASVNKALNAHSAQLHEVVAQVKQSDGSMLPSGSVTRIFIGAYLREYN